MIKLIIFDFDGVIAQSVSIKTEVFYEMFKQYPDHVDEIVQFHVYNGGMSRYEKFRHYYKNILRKPLSDEKFRELCDTFHGMVIDRVADSKYVDGAKELLDQCKGCYRMCIISGTPDEEIKEIVRRRELGEYFEMVLGSPKKKDILMSEVFDFTGISPKDAVFIGDAVNDLNAAKITGAKFIAITSGNEPSWLSDEHIDAQFKDANGVLDFIKSLTKDLS